MRFLIKKYIYIFSFTAALATVTAQAKDYPSKELDVDSLLSFESRTKIERGQLDQKLLINNDILKTKSEFGQSDTDVKTLLSFKSKPKHGYIEKKYLLNENKNLKKAKLDSDSLLSFSSKPSISEKIIKKNLSLKVSPSKGIALGNKNEIKIKKYLDKVNVLANKKEEPHLTKEPIVEDNTVSKVSFNREDDKTKEALLTKKDKDLILNNTKDSSVNNKAKEKINKTLAQKEKNNNLEKIAKKNNIDLASSLLGYKNKTSSIKKIKTIKDSLIKFRNLSSKKIDYVEISYKEKLRSLEKKVFLLEKEKEGLRQRLRFVEGGNIASLTLNNF